MNKSTKIVLEKTGADSSNKSGSCSKSYALTFVGKATVVVSFGKIGRAKNEQYNACKEPELAGKFAFNKMRAKLNDGYIIIQGQDLADELTSKYSRFRDANPAPAVQTTLELA